MNIDSREGADPSSGSVLKAEGTAGTIFCLKNRKSKKKREATSGQKGELAGGCTGKQGSM